MQKQIRHICPGNKAVNDLEEDLQLLGLGPLQDFRLQVFKDGHTQVHLVIWTHHHTGTNVMADFCPVQIVPEALSQPVKAHLVLVSKDTKNKLFFIPGLFMINYLQLCQHIWTFFTFKVKLYSTVSKTEQRLGDKVTRCMLIFTPSFNDQLKIYDSSAEAQQGISAYSQQLRLFWEKNKDFKWRWLFAPLSCFHYFSSYPIGDSAHFFTGHM